MGYFICGPESEELCQEIGMEVPIHIRSSTTNRRFASLYVAWNAL